jgi:hypothetical protein
MLERRQLLEAAGSLNTKIAYLFVRTDCPDTVRHSKYSRKQDGGICFPI